MTDATSGFGTLLKVGDGGGVEVFTALAEVTDISGPGLARDTMEVTNHLSPGGYREYLAGLKDAGEVSLDVNYLPANATHNAATGVLKDFDDGTKRNFQIVFPDIASTTWSFAAYVTAFEPKAPIDDKLSASITLKITGQPTLA